MKNQILQALQKSIINDQSVIQQISQIIKNLESSQNYCLSLMEIADDPTTDANIRLAALIQLKNNIQRRWTKHESQKITLIIQDEKDKIKQTLLTAMIRCKEFPALLRIYQSIVTLVVAYECKEWMPTGDVLHAIETQTGSIDVIVLFIQSVLKSFERPKIPKDSINKFNDRVIVFLYEAIVGDQKNIPLVYTVTKCMQKMFKLPLCDNIKDHIPMWMPLIKSIIDYNDDGLKFNETPPVNTEGYFLMKAKKWACKIVETFFRTHSACDYTRQNEEFMDIWMVTYGDMFMQSIISALSKPNLQKTYYFIFKTISSSIFKYQFLIDPYIELLLYEIIPRYSKVVEEDEFLAKNDPLELIKKQDDSMALDGNPKYAAINLWLTLVELGSSFKDEQQKEGPHVRRSLEWVFQTLKGEDLVTRQMALNLFCRTAFIYLKFTALRPNVIQLIQSAVLPNIQSSVLLVRARAVEVLQYYGRLQFSPPVLQHIVQHLYSFLTEDNVPLLNIRAAESLVPILCHPQALLIIKPHLKQLLQIFTKLITENEIENLVAGLECIINSYGQDIIPYSIDLIKYLTAQFVKFVERDLENVKEEVEDEGQFQMAAQACLDVLHNLINYDLPQEVLQNFEPLLVKILQDSFSSTYEEYYEGSMKLLNTYLQHSKEITPSIWYFYPIVLYSITGLSPKIRSMQVITPPSHPIQDKIIAAFPKEFNKINLEIATPCIRNYIHKSITFALESTDMFGVNMSQLLFTLFFLNYEPQQSHNSDQP